MAPQANHSVTGPSATSGDGKFDAIVCEISEKIDNGVHVELCEYEQRHPEFAARLGRIWPTLIAMADLGHRNSDVVEAGEAAGANVGVLGDFQIIREAGRGGMGVVYEATQISLGRRVALKVLPFASVMDKRQLQRFKNEAMAAAALDHPNIVSVFATGCERSVHFYAMHFVEGHTLAEVVAQLRTTNSSDQAGHRSQAAVEQTIEFRPSVGSPQPVAPSPTPSGETKNEWQAGISTAGSIRVREYFRSVTEIFKQAAEALDYAHGVGIVHRDIKPSNLILDDSGRCWVTDFGLAMVESSPNLTMTGDLLGTLRYMSPEQSLAQRVVIDHRTDVYSLGVTLYELLTLQPAHTGDDRQELLRRLAFEEPTAPRRLNSAIPSDLETIVLKAMSKNPADRYATAGDMAADLGRSLNGEPIHARRPTIFQRMVKWSLRHKPFVAAAATLLLLAAVGLGVSNVLIAEQRNEAVAAGQREKEERKAAQRERLRAERNLYLAEMRQAAYDLSGGSIRRLRETLARYETRPAKSDLRQWEWYYLRSLLPGNSIAEGELTANIYYNDFCWTASPLRLYRPGNKYVSVWDPAELRETRRIGRQEDGILSCDVHEASGRLATGPDGDDSIKIWDLKTGDLITSLGTAPKGPEGAIFWMRWSPDGRLLATFDGARYLKIWNVDEQEPLAQCVVSDFHPQYHTPQWSPTSREVAVLLLPWKHVLILGTDNATHRLETEGFFNSIAWDQSGTSLITTGAQFQVWDAATWTIQREFYSGDQYEYSCLSPDGQLLATAGASASIDVWKVDEGRRIAQLTGHSGPVIRVEWSPNGRWLASSSKDGSIRLWNVSEGYRSHVLQGAVRQPDTLSFSPDGAYLASWCIGLANGLQVWSVSNDKHAPNEVSLGQLARATLSADGKLVAGIDKDGDLGIWNVETAERMRRRRSEFPPAPGVSSNQSFGHSLAWSPSGQSIAWLNKSERQIRYWDLKTDQIESIPLPPQCATDGLDNAANLAWSPNSQRIACTTGIHLFAVDIASGEPALATRADLNFRPLIAWSATDRLAIAGNRAGCYGQVYLRDASDGRTLHIALPDKQDDVRPAVLSWTQDGEELAVGYQDGSIQIIDAKDGAARRWRAAHAGTVRAIAWTPNAARLASLGRDHIRLWDVETGGEMLVFDTGGRYLSQPAKLAWDPSGQRLALATGDGRVRTWDAAPGYKFADKSPAKERGESAAAEGPGDVPPTAEDSNGRLSDEFLELIISTHNHQQHAWDHLDAGDIESARASLAKAKQTLETAGQRGKALSKVAFVEHHFLAAGYLRRELGILFFRADAFNDAAEALGSLTFWPASYRGASTRRTIWHYCMALARVGKLDQAREIYNRLVQATPSMAEPNSADIRLLVTATELMAELSADQTAEQVLRAGLQGAAANPLVRARLYIAHEMWNEAADDIIATIELAEDSYSTRSPRKKACLTAAGWPEVFRRVVERRPDLTTLWIGHAQQQILRNQVDQAAASYQRGFVSRSVEDETVFEYAGTLLSSGDREGYESLCQQLEEHHANGDASFFDYVRARTCALAPSRHARPDQMIQWAETRLEDDKRAWCRHVAGLAYYRAGQYDRAVEHLEKSNADRWSPAAKSQNWLVLGMCRHQLGQAKEAIDCLEIAQDLIESATRAPRSIEVPDWIGIRVLQREAEELLLANREP